MTGGRWFEYYSLTLLLDTRKLRFHSLGVSSYKQKSQEEAIEPHRYGLWWSTPKVPNKFLFGMIVHCYVNKQLRKSE